MIYLNGKFYEDGKACIDPADRGLLLGDGLFETMAVRDGKIINPSSHLARLHQGMTIISLDINHDFLSALHQTIDANDMTNGSLRLTVTRGPAARGIAIPDRSEPTVMITATQSLPDQGPVTAIIAQSTRRNEFSPLSRCKNLNYLDNILAETEAKKTGADTAILLNTKGLIAETTSSNIFWVNNEQLYTPPASDGALPGTCREKIIREYSVSELSVGADALYKASEIFVTNALTIRPLVKVDDVTIGDGTPGPITKKIIGLFFK